MLGVLSPLSASGLITSTVANANGILGLGFNEYLINWAVGIIAAGIMIHLGISYLLHSH